MGSSNDKLTLIHCLNSMELGLAFATPVHSLSTGPNYSSAMGETATIEAAGRQRGSSQHHAIVCGPARRSYAKHNAHRGQFTQKLALSGPRGTTFEGPDGAGFEWELVRLPTG